MASRTLHVKNLSHASGDLLNANAMLRSTACSYPRVNNPHIFFLCVCFLPFLFFLFFFFFLFSIGDMMKFKGLFGVWREFVNWERIKVNRREFGEFLRQRDSFPNGSFGFKKFCHAQKCSTSDAGLLEI